MSSIEEEAQQDAPGLAARGNETVDLSEDSAFLAVLLDDTAGWRSRLRERLEFRSSTHVRVTSEFQVSFDATLFEGLLDVGRTRSINVMLPLTTRAKRPMVNECFHGPAGEAQLLRRSASALLQAAYVHELAADSPASGLGEVLTLDLLQAICRFTPERYERLRDDVGPVEALRRLYERREVNALDLPAGRVERWLTLLQEPRRILTAALAEGPSCTSSSENLLLALLEYRQRLTLDDIEDIVVEYRRGLASARAAEDEKLLSTVAEYGRRYEVILEVELPTTEACTVSMAEDRRLELHHRSYRHVFRCDDAPSVHLEARIDDPAVALSALVPDRAIGGVLHDETFEAHRVSEDAGTLYSARDDRPDFVEVLVTLAPARSVRSTAAGLVLLDVLGIVGVLCSPHDDKFLDRVAVLVVPTTLAATFALIREQTTLASVLLRPWRRALAWTIAVLWLIVVVELIAYDAPKPAEPASVPSARSLH